MNFNSMDHHNKNSDFENPQFFPLHQATSWSEEKNVIITMIKD